MPLRSKYRLYGLLWFTLAVSLGAEDVVFEPGEVWWGGLSVDGPGMPVGSDANLERRLWGNNGGNQAQPFLLSNRGRYVWSEEPFTYRFLSGRLLISANTDRVIVDRSGTTLREGFNGAARRFFPAAGRMPAEELFARPQYNTWIELMYDQNQADILRYAHAVVAQGYPPGVLMIDDNWQEAYGDWRFAARRFPDAKGMVDELHSLGFKVMLWVCPFVSADTPNFRTLDARGLLLQEADTSLRRAAAVRWWNGISACLDLTKPEAVLWFREQLHSLQTSHGVDGFKFDGGDAEYYMGTDNPNAHTEAFGRIGLEFPLNEYRASWKLGGAPLAQRLRDKEHRWEDLQMLIPGIVAQGLMGYPFTCPDMIGGGEFKSFLNAASVDGELVVRSAQVHALMPMMQFSVAPWRVLTADWNRLCREAALLHVRFAPDIQRLAEHAARTGEPIVRPLCWAWPEEGYEQIKDQFLLGGDVLVAPVVMKGARERSVVFPPGQWRDERGVVYSGPAVEMVDAPLDRLPWFWRAEERN